MSDETKLADRGDDVKQMSDEDLIGALETLAEQFCRETGYATMPVKLHGLEIRHRLESLRGRAEKLERHLRSVVREHEAVDVSLDSGQIRAAREFLHELEES